MSASVVDQLQIDTLSAACPRHVVVPSQHRPSDWTRAAIAA